MKIGKRLTLAGVAIALALAGIAAPASATDSRSGSRTCPAHYSVGVTTTTVGLNSHKHVYTSGSQQVIRNSGGLVETFSSRSLFRVASWTATTPGFFKSASSNCVLDPV